MKISAWVVSYNRENLIQACLGGLRFADEVILVDKSSTDRTREVAAKWADRIVTVPWSPASGDTAAHALSLCKHEWIVALSDDECLNVPAIDFILGEKRNPRADVYLLPRQDHVLGRFDEKAYYWPQWHPQFYRKGALEYQNTTHGAAQVLSHNSYKVPVESGVAIVHLSIESVEQWIEKSNRYTSQKDRISTYLDPNSILAPLAQPGSDLRAFARQAIDFWLAKAPSGNNDGYLVRIAILRAIYDLIDRVKQLEEHDNIDGRDLFRIQCNEMIRQYDSYFEGIARRVK